MRWQELGAALDHAASSEDVEDQIIAAARDAFAMQRQWLGTETHTAVGA
jgi:heme oxygenase